VKLNDGRLSLGRPGAHPGWALADAGLVDKDDQPTFSLGFFLRLGQVLRFQAHSVLVALDGALLWFLRTEAQGAQNSPDLCLAETHAVHAFDDGAHALECPQLGAKPMLSRALQKSAARTAASCCSSSWAGRPRSGTARSASMPPSSSSAFPRVHGLAGYAHGQCHVGAAFAREQHPTRLQSLLCCFAQPFWVMTTFSNITTWRYNVSDDQKLS
jgi:hypothetical protein